MGGASLDGRSPGSRCPIHGKQEYDTGTFYGGNYATIHPEFYKDTVFKGTRATDLGELRRAAGGFAGGTEAGHQKPFAGSKMFSARICPT